ncbi:4-amino-4-deoxy-L-arabinose transferase-like glycosyltransferase [Azospirillum brasilense]|uniref:4-amino-4-deoxy-L-arabinose transferase-like glycosyltransferase n=2 Tax=Azospirillum brasilense TaxID=192 RepID=A0A560BWW8_AZOBR|nr:4-amino-4-deoxy-L-arabinose transferase-like glycosyltransferase [Azospirillum brasilense]
MQDDVSRTVGHSRAKLNDIPSWHMGMVERKMNKSSEPKISKIVASAALISIIFLISSPFRLQMPQSGLDPSWNAVIAKAAVEGWQWGRDVIFTFGPYGYLYSHTFQSNLWGSVVSISAALSIVFGIGAVGLIANINFVRAIITSAALILGAFALLEDSFYFAFPLFILTGYFRLPTAVPTWRLVLFTVAAGLSALIKISFGALALAIVILIDAHRIFRKNPPVFTPVFVSSVLFFYVISGQDLHYFADFLTLGFQVVSGYSEAMAMPGSTSELVSFLVLSAISFLAIVAIEYRNGRLAGRPLDVLALLAGLGLFWFMVFKAGFVRHDLHSMIAWAAAGCGIALYVASLGNNTRAGLLTSFLLGLALLMSLVAPYRYSTDQNYPFGPLLYGQFVAKPKQSLNDIAAFASNPSHWIEQKQEDYNRHLEALRKAEPIPVLQGTVDVLPSIQAAVLASGNEYRPRPIFQEYSTYTPMLIEANRRFLLGDRAPDNLLFSVGSIDNRHPALAEGPLWPDILQRYEPVRLESSMLMMRKRSIPAPLLLADAHTVSAGFSENVALPQDADALFMSVDIDMTLLGKLLKTVFRVPTVDMTVTLAGGEEKKYRLIPGIAKSGFIISPHIENNFAFEALSAGMPELFPNLKVVSIRLDTDNFLPWVKPNIHFHFQPLHVDGLRQPTLAEGVRRELAMYETLRTLASSSSVRAPFVEISEQKLLAHAPTSMFLDVASAQRVDVEFGIRDVAWQANTATDGVCFRISMAAPDGASVKAWERCLRPTTALADRGVQSVSIDAELPAGGRLTFETDCGGNCSWDWAYWQNVAIVP